MDSSFFSAIFSHGNWASATCAQGLPNSVHGFAYGHTGPQPFVMDDRGIFGNVFSMNGRTLLVKPDVVSRTPFGRSFTAFDGLAKQGWIGNSTSSPSLIVGGQMSSQMGTALAASLRCSGQL
jgi:hypothetical protein